MNFSDMIFRRKFSMNLRKNLKIPMAKMTFTSAFLDTVRGDLYPVISASEGAVEHVNLHGYRVNAEGGHVERLMSAFFPYATYAMAIDELDGSAGFVFVGPNARVEISVLHEDWETYVVVDHSGGKEKLKFSHDIEGDFSLVVSNIRGNFHLYIAEDDKLHFIKNVTVPEFNGCVEANFYNSAKTHLRICGKAHIKRAEP